MNSRLLCCARILFNVHQLASAQVYKCQDSGGNTVFQGTPCAPQSAAKTRTVPTVGQKAEVVPRKNGDDVSGTNWDTAPHPPRAVQPNPPQANYPVTNQPPPPQTWQTKSKNIPKGPAEKQSDAYNEQVRSYNKNNECNNARQQLGVAKENHKVYSRDNNGDRHYVSDSDRPELISAAEQRVAAACN